jgi:hypothetical protein
MLGHDLPLIHVVLGAADDLVGLMALARQDDNVSGLMVVDGIGDGLPPVRYDSVGRPGPRQTLDDVIMIALGSSVRGLSEVMTTLSAYLAARPP